MKPIELALKEIRLSWNIIRFSSILIEVLLVFTGSLILTTLLGISWVFALVPTTIYVGYKIYLDITTNKYKDIEEKATRLKEKLRTAADNIKVENKIVNELQNEVIEDIKKVKSSFLVDYKLLSYKLLGLIFISFMVIGVSILNVNLGGLEGITDSLNKIKFINEKEKIEIPDVKIASQEGNLDIYDENSVAELGLKKEELEINPLDSEIDLSKIGGVEKKNFAPQSIPKEIYTTYDVSYNEKIPKENQKIVKNYFDKITK